MATSGYLNTSLAWDPASASSVLDPAPTSLDEVRARHMALYQHGIQTGRFEALVFPYSFLHIYLLPLYFILVPPSWLDAKASRGSSWCRGRRWILIQVKYALYLLFVWRTVVVISVCRSPNAHMVYRMGIAVAFIVWWIAALFIFRDPTVDFMRLRREKKMPVDGSSAPVQKTEASTTGASSGVHSRSSKMAVKPQPSPLTQENRQEYVYYWQGMPPTLGQRALWVMDLITALRGAGWTHQIRTLPVPPPEALAQLPASSPLLKAKPRRVGMQGPNARARLLRYYLVTLAVCFVFSDVFQSFLVMHDPYFIGLVDAPFPPGLLPRPLSESPVFVRGLRIVASGTATVVWLTSTFASLYTVKLVFAHADDVQAEPWMWADLFQDPRIMLDHGLAGLWGEVWHQGMRINLSTPSEALSAACGWGRRDPRAHATAVVFSFLISGVIHYVGSYMQLGDTQPIRIFVFFALQGVGILVETLVGTLFSRLGLRLPEGCMRVVRGVWAGAFLCFTGSPMADEMARGGEYLSEPLPFSVVRSLGLGPTAGSGWLTLGEPIVWWHTGDVWWKSGFAL